MPALSGAGGNIGWLDEGSNLMVGRRADAAVVLVFGSAAGGVPAANPGSGLASGDAPTVIPETGTPSGGAPTAIPDRGMGV